MLSRSVGELDHGEVREVFFANRVISIKHGIVANRGCSLLVMLHLQSSKLTPTSGLTLNPSVNSCPKTVPPMSKPLSLMLTQLSPTDHRQRYNLF